MVLLVLPMANAADRSTPAVSEKVLRQLLVENPDSVLNVLDEIENAGKPSIPPFRISLLRALAYNEKRMFSYVYKSIPTRLWTAIRWPLTSKNILMRSFFLLCLNLFSATFKAVSTLV